MIAETDLGDTRLGTLGQKYYLVLRTRGASVCSMSQLATSSLLPFATALTLPEHVPHGFCAPLRLMADSEHRPAATGGRASGSTHTLRLPSFSELVEGVPSLPSRPTPPPSLPGARRAESSLARTPILPSLHRSRSSELSSSWRPFEPIPPHAGASSNPHSHSFDPQHSHFGPAAPYTASSLSRSSPQSFQHPAQAQVGLPQTPSPVFPAAVTIPYEPEPKTWVMPFESVQSLEDLRDTDGKPRYPYPVLIRAAIMSSPEHKLRLQEIYAAIENKAGRSGAVAWRRL